jgi:hypothetical protein
LEAAGTVRSEVEAELASIEASLDKGQTDLKALGFWPLVARVKADPTLADQFADRIGAIDTRAFRSAVRLRAPVWAGNLVLLAGTLAGCAAVAFALRTTTTAAWSGIALIVAAGVWAVSLHCPAHWVVGRVVGIRFTDYFLGGPPPPRPGLKSDYGSYLRTAPAARAWMHASGALATKLAPFLALAFWPASGAPWWSAAVLVGLGAFQIATDITLSVKSSDWKKFRREMAVSRAARTSN